MDATQVIRNPRELMIFEHQHNRMLQLCSQIADLNMPALVHTLAKMRAQAGEGSTDAKRDHTLQVLEANLAVAVRAIEVHREVRRQKARCNQTDSVRTMHLYGKVYRGHGISFR
jgi:hypothetical protein